MANNPPNPPTQADLQAVFALAQQYEDIAQAIFTLAQAQVKQDNDQSAFNDVYGNYLTIMQKAQDMYYSASHAQALAIATSADIAAISAATKKLNDAVTTIKTAQKVVTISLGALAVVGTVAAAIVDPTHVSAGAALTAIGDFVTSLAGLGGGGGQVATQGGS